MIISFKHNYIYFRPKKTGSSTIEDVLSQDLGPDDIIAGKRAARIPGGGGEERFSHLVAHTHASDIKDMVPPQFWNKSYKFASVRHPYEMAVSLAYYRLHKLERRSGVEETEKEFSRILNEVVKGNHCSSLRYYGIDGAPVVDDYIRHETFETDLRRIATRIGVAVPDELPQRKQGLRLDRRPAREILTDEQKQAIFARCRREFELLGYEP